MLDSIGLGFCLFVLCWIGSDQGFRIRVEFGLCLGWVLSGLGWVGFGLDLCVGFNVSLRRRYVLHWIGSD